GRGVGCGGTARMLYGVENGRALPLAWRVRQGPKGPYPEERQMALVDLGRAGLPEGTPLSSVGFSLMLLWEAVDRHGAGRRPARDCSATVLGVCTLLAGADQDRAQPE